MQPDIKLYFRGTSRPEVFPIRERTKIHNEADRGEQREKKFASTVRPGLSGLPGNSECYVVAERGRYNKDGTTSQKIEKRKDGLTNTLTGVEKDNRIFNGKIRRLTPTECERLQGFPDGWTKEISDTQRYKCLGNAVTVNVIEAIANELL